jgi:hypothetical protein
MAGSAKERPTMNQERISQRAAELKQRQEFDAAAKVLRDKWRIEQPEIHVMPRWLRPLVNAAIREKILPKPEHSLDAWFALQHAAKSCGGDMWIDHHGRIRLPDGTQRLISEPYQLLPDGRDQLEQFCRTLGLQFAVQDESWWFPGQTLRITISQSQEAGK